MRLKWCENKEILEVGGDPKRLEPMQVREPVQEIQAAHVQLQDFKGQDGDFY